MKPNQNESGILSFLTRQSKRNNSSEKEQNEKIKSVNEEYLKQMNSPVSEQNKTVKNPMYMYIKEKNPFYEYAKSYAQDSPVMDEAQKRWKQVGAAAALTNVASAIGKGISIMNGAKVRNINTSTADKAIRHIDKYNDFLRDDTRRYNNELTRIALHGENRADRATENYIKSLEREADRINRDSIATKRDISRTLINEERMERTSTEKALDRAEKSAKKTISDSLKAKTSKVQKATAAPKPKVVTFLKDKNQNSVPIFEDDITQLYRIADLSGYLEPYRKGKNSQEKRMQLNVALQKAFIDYSEKHNDKKGKGVDFLPNFFFYPQKSK